MKAVVIPTVSSQYRYQGIQSYCDVLFCPYFPSPDASAPRTRQPVCPADTSGPPPPFSSTENLGPEGKAMLLHMQFFQSLCGLCWAEGKDGGLEAAWLSSDEHAGSVLVDSVCQLLDSVVAACRDAPPLPPSALLLQACQVAARASDLCCSQNQPSAKLKTHVEESLRELTGMLLHCDQLNKVM